MKLRLLAAFAAALLAGCGATEGPDDAASPPPPPRTVTGPSDPPPELPKGFKGPPPAWIETERGAFWLAYSTFCWDPGGCADYMAPRCGDELSAPPIIVRPGEAVRFHLGFTPREVSLNRFPGGDVTVSLESTHDPTWRVARPGAWLLFALAASGQGGADASYAACFRYEALTVAEAVAQGEGHVVVEGPLWAEGDDVRLCDAVAESFPPQCPSGYLQVRGLDLAAIEGLQAASGVRWTDGAVRLNGTLDGNVLHVRG
jgi:hypothetical protein